MVIKEVETKTYKKEEFNLELVDKISHLKSDVWSGFAKMFKTVRKGETVHRLIGRMPEHVTVCYIDDEPIGWCVINKFIGDGHLIGIYVRSERRREGIGKELVELTLDYFEGTLINIDEGGWNTTRIIEAKGFEVTSMWDDETFNEKFRTEGWYDNDDD